MMDRIRVYVAGPLTSSGRVSQNVHDAVVAAKELWDLGFSPFVPQLSTFADAICPMEYEEWMEYDFGWLEACDILLRLPGESSGADREMERARELGMDIFYGINALRDWGFLEIRKRDRVG